MAVTNQIIDKEQKITPLIINNSVLNHQLNEPFQGKPTNNK